MILSDHELMQRVASVQAVPARYLQVVRQIRPACEEFAKKYRRLIQQRQCYQNAYILSSLFGFDIAIGYVYSADLGIVTEHAWNIDKGQHFDLTSQLHWKKDSLLADKYVTLLTLSTSELDRLFEETGVEGVDHFILRKSKTYRHLFEPSG